MSIKLSTDELVELIEMHGRNIFDDCMCPDCMGPLKSEMLVKVERMRQLIELLPVHVDPDEAAPRRSIQ